MKGIILSIAFSLVLNVSVSALAQEAIQIISPKNGDDVGNRLAVLVRAKDVSASVWVIVHPIGTDGYWVQPPPDRTDKGQWDFLIHIGRSGPIDAGKSFEIVAVANPKNGLKEGDQLKSWPQAQARSNLVRVRRAQ